MDTGGAILTSPWPARGPLRQFLNGADPRPGDGLFDALAGFAAAIFGLGATLIIAAVNVWLGALALAANVAWAFCMWWGRP